MKAMRSVCLLVGFSALVALSGCVVAAGPTVYVPSPPPVCPDGYYWSPGYGCVPAPVMVAPSVVYAQVNTQYLSLRSCPTTKCGILASLDLGEQVQVLYHQGGWTHVFVPTRGLEGWVATKYID